MAARDKLTAPGHAPNVDRRGPRPRILDAHDHTPTPRFQRAPVHSRPHRHRHLRPARAPVANALYEFGGGFPDPVSFPYDGLVEATARMMKVGGRRRPSPTASRRATRACAELVCHKYGLFEGLKIAPDNIIISNGSGHALSLAFSRLRRTWATPSLSEAPTFSGTLNTIRRHGAARARRAGGRGRAW